MRALKDINLEIFPEEFVIFFGPSGCGKSTLLYCLAGLERNLNGNVFLGTQDITRLDENELELFHQRKIGMIFQAYYLIQSLTILRNVALPEVFTSQNKKEREEKAKKLLERFGVSNQANKLPNELSGGQQQKAAIARALINEPEIILADEPVGNLDSKSSTEVLSLLKDLNKNNKKTIILVTHNADHLKLAHRVFYLKDGYIVDTKVNEKVAGVEGEKEPKLEMPHELELLVRTFSSLSPSQVGTMLTPFKAKQIVSEILTEMTIEEVSKIEKQVENLLMTGLASTDGIAEMLDKSVAENGLGLDRRSAEKIAQKIKQIVEEIRQLEEIENIKKTGGYKPAGIDAESIQVRQYLFDYFNIKINSFDNLEAVDKAIDDRLNNRIDINKFQEILDLPIKEKGAGMDKRTVKKLSKRLELLILGKYK